MLVRKIQKKIKYVLRSNILTAVNMSITVFRVVHPEDRNNTFLQSVRNHLQGLKF